MSSVFWEYKTNEIPNLLCFFKKAEEGRGSSVDPLKGIESYRFLEIQVENFRDTGDQFREYR